MKFMRKLVNLLFPRVRELPSVHVRLVDINPLNLTLAEWVKHSELVHEANQLSKTPLFKTMIEVLKNECPANYVMPIGTQPTDLIRKLGETDGYNKAINNMIAMTVLTEAKQPLVATFEQETEEEKK